MYAKQSEKGRTITAGVAAVTHRWIKFWPQDWQRDPALRSCSPAARGVWMDMLCIMHDAEPYGHLIINGKPATAKQIARISGVSEKEAGRLTQELEDNGVFSRTTDGVIHSRRMVRDKQVSEKATVDGKDGGNPEIRRGSVPKEARVRPYKRSDSPAKTERIFAKKGGNCWWCDRVLQTEAPGPDFFHVDHVVPVCDGGTNDESNLVPACAECNHDRAKVRPTRTAENDRPQAWGLLSECDRPQTLEARSKKQKEEPPSLRSGPPTDPSRGTRLPADWQPDAACVEAARDVGMDACALADGFRDYRHAKAGKPRVAPAGDFDAFWAAYPRKVGKDLARKAFAAACKRAQVSEIMAGLSRFRWPDDPQFIPHPSSWLNAGRWADEATPGKAAPQSPRMPGQMRTEAGRVLTTAELWDVMT